MLKRCLADHLDTVGPMDILDQPKTSCTDIGQMSFSDICPTITAQTSARYLLQTSARLSLHWYRPDVSYRHYKEIGPMLKRCLADHLDTVGPTDILDQPKTSFTDIGPTIITSMADILQTSARSFCLLGWHQQAINLNWLRARYPFSASWTLFWLWLVTEKKFVCVGGWGAFLWELLLF